MPSSHFNQAGQAIMVDIADKNVTVRTAVACGRIHLNTESFLAVKNGTASKGDVLGVARIASIMAVKRTAELIPLCHHLLLNSVTVDFILHEERSELECFCKVGCDGKTGVEMEALTGVSIALLTVYDMCKSMDKGMEIGGIHLLSKEGGRSGRYQA